MANNLKLINTNTINSKPIRNYIKVKNTGGPKGDTGATGATGPQGPQGPAGQAATINIGETTTLLPGQTATVTNTGTQQNATLNFGIPQGLRGPTGAQGPKGDTGPQGLKGDKGNDGAAATIQVNATNTGEPGTNAQVTNIGNEHFAQLNFTIPRGATGATGAQGPQGPQGQKGDKGDTGSAATVTVGSTTTTSPGTSATVTNSGTTSAAVLNFGIPSGAPGKVKSEVVSELPETGEDDKFYLERRDAVISSVTGKTINFTNPENSGVITDAQIDGNTAQNGTPTPSAPVAVQTVTGENVIRITGKNLFQVTATSASVSSGVTYAKLSDSSFSIASDGSSSWARADVTLPQALELNTTYTFKVNFTSTNASITSVRASFRTSSAEASVFTLTNGQSAQLSTGNNLITTIRLYISTNTAYSGTVTFSDVQLELGSSASTYEAYKSQSYEINLGKNLLTFGNSDISGELNGITYSYNATTQEWTFDGTASARADIPYPSGADVNMHLRSGIKYTTTGFYQSGTISGGSIKLFQQDSHHNWQGITVTMSSASTNSESYTPSAELVLDDSHIFRIASGTVLSNYKVKFQTEIAPATSYAPYFTPIELCKIGDYQDYIWNDNGTWKVHKVIGKNVFTGSEQWFRSGRTTATVFMASTEVLSLTIKNDERQQSISSHFKFSGSTGIGNFDLYNGSASAQYLVFGLDATSVPDVTAAKAWVTANQPTIYYILTTPTDETITNATLIAQLDALAEASIYGGVNNITTITPNELPTLELDYVTYDKYNQNKVYIWNDDLDQFQVIVP